MTTSLADLPTPSLILDRRKLLRNVERLAALLEGTGVALRPHLKTAKSIDVARLVLGASNGPATVSTLKEAQVFGRAGITDLLYAVQLAPQKLAEVTRLRREGIDLKVVVDSKSAAELVSAHSVATGDPIPCFIEIDVDGHRAGLAPSQASEIVDVGRAIARGARLMGVMTHAGESYELSTPDALRNAAENERLGAVRAAAALRGAGLDCPIISIGSSPTAHALENFDGVTEIRAGVYMFGDLVQAGIGVCAIDDIALSVLATVIGHQPEKGWILVDCGWTAMSSDRGTASQKVDHYLGLVTDESGAPLQDVVLLRAYQEHGIVALRPGGNGALPNLAVGARIRILPNHACATGTQHQRYDVVEDGRVVASWPRFSGWELDSEPPNFTIVGRDAVRASATRQGAFDAVASAFKAMSSGEAKLFPVVNAVVEAPNTAFTIKSGANQGQGIVGVKIGSYWPRNMERFGIANHGSTTLLLDNETGAPRALVNARELNGLRTAAANAVATDALARTDAEVLLVIGAGHQARYEARAICDVRRIKRLMVWSRTRAQAENMVAELSDLGVDDIAAVEDANAAAAQADIITTVTTARTALLSAAGIRPGVHISAMGADMDGKQELDFAALKAALLFADWPAQSAQIGEFQHVCKAGLRMASDIVAIGDVLLGRRSGRVTRDDITVFDSSGVAIQDLNVAQAVLDAAVASGRSEAVRF